MILKYLSNSNKALAWLMFILSFSCFSAEKITPEQLKVALVVNMSKHIIWPDNGEDKLNIVIYKQPNILSQFNAVAGYRVQQKEIVISHTDSLLQLKKADIVFIAREYSQLVDSVAAGIRQSRTLLITDESDNQHNTMINLQTLKGKVNFVVNRSNIIYEGLQLKPQLLLLGGTELDVATLYRETESALQKLKDQNNAIETELQDKQMALNEALSSQIQVEQKLTALQKQLNNSQQALENKQLLIKKSEQMLASKAQEYEAINQQRLATEQKLKIENKTLSQKQLQQTELLNSIEKQLSHLNSLEQDIANKNLLLSQKNEQLSSQVSTIKQQTIYLYLAIFIGVIILVFLLVIIGLYRKNKRFNKELMNTVELLQKTQRQLVESEKMASIGNLVAGVAHELNTPIGISITCISHLGDRARDLTFKLENKALTQSQLVSLFEELIESEKILTHNLTRCADLITSFKQVSADQVIAKPRQISLLNYINEVMSTLSVKLKREQVKWQLRGDNIDTFLDPGLIAQVISNLVVNSIEHGFNTSDEQNIKQKDIGIRIENNTDWAVITYQDNGIGMNEKTRSNIFEPFFTTARHRGGTGLGMNIVHNLVTAKLHGEIAVESAPDEGCKITIKLPITTN